MFLFGGKYNNCLFRKEADLHERDIEKDRETKSGDQQVGLMLYTLHVWDIIIASKLHRSLILVEVTFLKTPVHQVTCEREIECIRALVFSTAATVFPRAFSVLRKTTSTESSA